MEDMAAKGRDDPLGQKRFAGFRNQLNNLVTRWADDDAKSRQTALKKIYDDIREEAVHDLAEAVRARDRATRTHGMLIITDRKHQPKKPE
jgi:hypothetical protein